MYTAPRTLMWHVVVSNVIEGIRDRSGPYFVSHLDAARTVARYTEPYRPLHPNRLHRLLAKGTRMAAFGGRPRTCRIFVGDRECPRPEYVPELMAWWWGEVRSFAALPRPTLAKRARELHELLLCIHPYEDGNGRTARLLYNSLRLSRGLPWDVIEVHQSIYYARIRRTEKCFKERFPTVYV